MKAKKIPYKPEVGHQVLSRWMFNKKDKVKAGQGRSHVGKWYASCITMVNCEAKTVSVKYDDTGECEDDVLFKALKLQVQVGSELATHVTCTMCCRM